jgi:signal transduction histidine kinase
VHAHGGKLAYRPEPGGGACFYFTLPAPPKQEP